MLRHEPGLSRRRDAAALPRRRRTARCAPGPARSHARVLAEQSAVAAARRRPCGTVQVEVPLAPRGQCSPSARRLPTASPARTGRPFARTTWVRERLSP
ncbi:hypothetical protein E6R60_14800 [Streptomyces sp. A0642]|nr:hypothetical protein E6R60_14800 [Streptomyces sp. A0642]